MYYNQDEMFKDLKAQGYVQKDVKPWNVREGDVYVMSDASFYTFTTMYVPVIVTLKDRYREFSRPYPYTETARTAYRFYHKPLNSEDLRFLYDRHKTEGWNRFDTVEIWRKPAKTA